MAKKTAVKPQETKKLKITLVKSTVGFGSR
jgi:hypothetical protein